MPFKYNRRPIIAQESPESLFRDLKNRKVQGLLSHQADVLRAYQDNMLDTPDIALQLPTGSGKTLVGLLAGEWRRRHYSEKIVYLCPTKQLVNQVVEQANEIYGIKANALVGKKTEYPPSLCAEYQNNEALTVTTYSSIFNTKSKLQKSAKKRGFSTKPI